MLSLSASPPLLHPRARPGDRSPVGRGRYVQLTNWLAVFAITIGSGYLGAYALAGERAPMLVIGANIGAAILALALNRRGRHDAARHVLLTASNLCIFAFAAWLGRESGVYLTYFITMSTTVLLFSPQDLPQIILALAQPVVMILALHLHPEPIPVFGHLPDNAIVRGSDLASILLTASTLLLTLFTFSKAILRSERMAEAALARLDREISLVKLLQDVAIIANNADDLGKAVAAAMQRISALTRWGLGRFVPYDDEAWRRCAFKHDAAALASSTWASGPNAPGAWCDACREALRAPGEKLIAVPVLVGREVVGIMQFTSAGEAPSMEMLSNLDNIGRQLGMVEERQRAQRQVSDSHIKMIAAAKMATLGEMAGGIAHEINNPLSVIQGYLARIKKFQSLYSGDEAIAHTDATVEAINATIMRITRIVNGLRAFARDSTNDPFEPVTVTRLVQDTLSLSAERFRSRGVVLDIVPVPADLTVECRSSQISQVLMNLLNNAMDAVVEAPAPAARRVTIAALDVGASVDVVVTDNGPGIPDALRDKVMQPFFTTKPVGQGTGLGLSISKGIVESHHGTLAFSSRPGATEFRVRLPKEQGL